MDLVQQVSEQVFIPLTVGGGIRTFDDIQATAEEVDDGMRITLKEYVPKRLPASTFPTAVAEHLWQQYDQPYLSAKSCAGC